MNGRSGMKTLTPARLLLAGGLALIGLLAIPALASALPRVTITGPRSPMNTATPTFNFRASEAVGSYECRLDSTDDSAFALCASPFTTLRLGDGAHTLDVFATNTGGTPGPIASHPFTVDTQPPDAQVTGPRRTRRREFLVQVQATDGSNGSLFVSVKCSLDGQQPRTCPIGTWGLRVARGRHVLRVTATDRAGNPDPTPAIYAFRVLPRKRKH